MVLSSMCIDWIFEFSIAKEIIRLLEGLVGLVWFGSVPVSNNFIVMD
jgi:hypothetical protein